MNSLVMDRTEGCVMEKTGGNGNGDQLFSGRR